MTAPTYNQGVMLNDNIALEGPISLDPHTILTVARAPGQPTRTLTVANGSSVLVYDMSNPSSPVLIRTIG